MSILVEDVVKALAATELYNSSFFDNSNEFGVPTDKHLPRLRFLIQQAVDTLYRKFSVQTKAVWVIMRRDLMDYKLQGQQPYLHQGKTEIDLANLEPPTVDEWGIPNIPHSKAWDDDLKRVRGVYDIDSTWLPINVQDRRNSVFMRSYNILSFPGIKPYRYVYVTYDVKAPKLTSMGDDTGLPETCMAALRYFIARCYYTDTAATADGMRNMQFYATEFQNAVKELELNNVFTTDELYYNREVVKGKWNR